MQLRRRLAADHRRNAGRAADGAGGAASRRRHAGKRAAADDAGAVAGQPAAVDLHGIRTADAAPSLGGGGSAPTPTPAPFSTGIFGEKPKTVGPIVGVRATLHKKALRKWRDREWYDEWRFIAGDADNDMATLDPNTLRGGSRPTPSPGAP